MIKKYLIAIKPFIYFLLITITTILCLFIVNYIINIIIGLYTGEFDFNENIFLDIPYLSSLLVSIIYSVVYLIWYCRLKKNETPLEKRRITTRDVSFLVIWSIGIILLVNGIMSLLISLLDIYYPKLISNYRDMMSYIDEGNRILLALSAAVAGPIAEELVFRGVILKRAGYIMPFYAANILQSFLFSLSHMNLLQMIYTFPIGFFYGYVTMRYKSIIPSIILHMLFNAFTVITSIFGDKLKEQMENSIWLYMAFTLVGALVFFACFYVMRRDTAIKEKV